jgi:hypothetical protein
MDPSKTMTCPACGNVVAVTDQFCSKCYARLEPPTFWRRLGSWFRSALKVGPHTLVIKRRESFRTISKQGEAQVYHSLDQVPPEFRAEVGKLQAAAVKALEGASSPGIVVQNEIRVFKFKDIFGKEQVYHSLEEMPPEQRALFEKARGQLNLPDKKNEG